MVYTFSTSPALSSSPPARSPAVPIKRAVSKGPAASSKPAGEQQLPAAAADRRASDDGFRRTSGGRASLVGSSASTPSSAKPPAGPSAVKAQHVLMGFDAPSTGAPAAAAAPSPVVQKPRASLLSQQLLDTAFSRSADLDDLLSPRDIKAFKSSLADAADRAALEQLQAQHEVFASPVVATAYALAARAHAGQLRKSGDTVLSHCVATAQILAELGLPEHVVAAALLHDVLSDTRLTACQLEEHLHRDVVGLVQKVARISEISQVYRDNTTTLEAEKLLDMLTTMADVSALLIKLADRLHNMRTIGALPRCKQVRMASETMEVFTVLANRLGAWAMKAELEDLCFKTLQPEDYAATASAIAAHEAAGAAAGSSLGDHVAAVTAALEAAGLTVVDVSGRVKNVWGVWKKMRGDRGGPVEDGAVREVYDVQALRVVVPHKHDCYAALRAVESLWAPVPGRFKDYIRARKANGYQSLHTTVRDAAGRPLEVQIRTPKMHYIAEYGFAAHWRYKEALSREDLWLDRLVQWKKWVATKKLGVLDRKVRAAGSPGRDAALDDVAEALHRGSHQQQEQQQQQQQLAAAAAGGRASRPVVASAAVVAGGGGSPPAAPGTSPGQQQQQQRAAESAQRFAARYGLRPITEQDLASQAATVLVSAPRCGAQLVDVPPGATVAHLLRSPALRDQGLWGAAVRLNGQLLRGLERWERLLRAGDQVEVLEGAWDSSGGGAAPGDKPAPQEPAAAAAQGGGEGGVGGAAQEGDSEQLQELQRQLRSALATAAVR